MESIAFDRGGGWFAVRQFAPGTYCIAEPSIVNSFLVLGRDRAALIDTGLAVGDIAACVRRITDLPVSVINTHYHHDHAGNNWRFRDVAIHALGAEELASGPDRDEAAEFIAYVERLIAAGREAEALDRAYFHLFDSLSRPRPFPPDFAPAGYTVRPSRATRLLQDGDSIDLGGRRLDVIHTPGHTPDSICLLDPSTGVLFGGDTINSGPVYAQGSDSDVAAFLQSCRRLRAMAADVSMVAVAHFGRAVVDRDFISEHAAGFEAVVEGGAVWRLGRDESGPCAEAVFDRFSILLPLNSPVAPRHLRAPA